MSDIVHHKSGCHLWGRYLFIIDDHRTQQKYCMISKVDIAHPLYKTIYSSQISITLSINPWPSWISWLWLYDLKSRYCSSIYSLLISINPKHQPMAIVDILMTGAGDHKNAWAGNGEDKHTRVSLQLSSGEWKGGVGWCGGGWGIMGKLVHSNAPTSKNLKCFFNV